MFFDADKQNMTVGYKQTLRAVKDGLAKSVYIAESCEDRIKVTVEDAARMTDTQIFYINTIRELGSMCGIEVGASCAAVLK